MLDLERFRTAEFIVYREPVNRFYLISIYNYLIFATAHSLNFFFGRYGRRCMKYVRLRRVVDPEALGLEVRRTCLMS